VAASVTVTLDVTPPEVVFGQPQRASAGRARVPYLIDEPGLTEASIDDVPAAIAAAHITSAQTFPMAGAIHITAVAVDDVGNQRSVAVEGWLPAPDSLGVQVVSGGIPHLGAAALAVL
jgi:hypothetical protein